MSGWYPNDENCFTFSLSFQISRLSQARITFTQILNVIRSAHRPRKSVFDTIARE